MEHTSDLFYDHASIDYPILDCDAHVNEPPDTWVGRVPREVQGPRAEGRAPRRGRLLVVQRRRERPPGRPHRHRRAVVPRLRARRRELRVDAAGKLRHQGAPRRHGHRRDVPAGALPERDPARRQDLRLRARAAGRVRARLQRLARRVLRGLRRSPHRPGHPAHHRRRRHRRRDEALPSTSATAAW